MRKLRLLITMVIITSMLSGFSSLGETRKQIDIMYEYLISAAQQDYPGWRCWDSDWSTETLDDDKAIFYVQIKMYRILDDRFESQELSVHINPYAKVERIPWTVTQWVPVTIAPGMAETLIQMKPKDIFYHATGASFTQQTIPMLAPAFINEDERLDQLMACSECILAVTESVTGKYKVKIAEWNGTEFGQIISTPAQDVKVQFNDMHSWNDYIELRYGDMIEVYANRSPDGIWQLDAINDGFGIISIMEDRSIDIFRALDYDTTQNNDYEHYGKPMFSVELTEIDLSKLPVNIEEAVALMDHSLSVCTAHDDTALYAMPGGDQIATCYTKVPGTIVSKDGEWIKIRIGSIEQGLIAWTRQQDLSFGLETEKTVCTFPSFDEFYIGEDEPRYATTLDGRSIQLDSDEHLPWLIGKTPDGSWLVLLNGQEYGTICTASGDTFLNIGPTKHNEEPDWQD